MTNTEPTDEQLLYGYACGQAEAFDVLVSRYGRRLFEFALRLLGDAHAAEDVTQEAFIRVHMHAGRYRYGGAPFSTWIYRIVRNLAFSELRRKRRKGTAESDARLSELQETADPASSSTSELQTMLEEGLRRLPPEQRAVFILRERQGMSYEKIAKVLGARVGTVKSRLNRARNSLARALAPYLDGGSYEKL